MVKMMIVDDETEICDFVKSFFLERNFQVITANNGSEALRLIESKAPHIVLLDLLMPVMDGMAMLQTLWERRIKSRVILITAVEDREKMAEAKRYGAAAYMTKPILLEELERNVAKLAEECK